jgi:hypothetical protein
VARYIGAECNSNTPKYYPTVERDSTTDELSECARKEAFLCLLGYKNWAGKEGILHCRNMKERIR